MPWLEWMAWTMPVALFFAAVAVLLLGMTVWEVLSPTVPRRGGLPLVTSRGDRLFLGLLTAAYVNLAWIGLTNHPPGLGAGLSLVVVLVVMRWA